MSGPSVTSAPTRRRRRSSRRFPAPLVAGLAAVGLLGLSAWALMGEVSSYWASGGTDAAFFERLTTAPPSPAISYSGAEAILMRCELTATSAYVFRQDEAERIFAMAHCRDFAQQTLASMPSYSYGWYSLALFHLVLGDLEAGLEALSQSQRTGSNEQWVAERRVLLGELVLSELSADARAAHDTDLAMLAQSNRGVRAIAKRYIEVEDFRERITAIVETLPEEAQARFVGQVRAAARQANTDASQT